MSRKKTLSSSKLNKIRDFRFIMSKDDDTILYLKDTANDEIVLQLICSSDKHRKYCCAILRNIYNNSYHNCRCRCSKKDSNKNSVYVFDGNDTILHFNTKSLAYAAFASGLIEKVFINKSMSIKEYSSKFDSGELF